MNQIEGIELREAPDRQALAEVLAEDVAQALREALQARGSASLVVSGGSTPVPMFEHLSTLELDWSSVRVTLADERIVPPEHEQSNERMVRATLLQQAAATAQFISLHALGLRQQAGAADAEHAPVDPVARQAAMAELEARLDALRMPFDVLLLGMGADGHTASLFPDAPELARAMRSDAAERLMVMRPPSQPLVRLSMTARLLVDARRVWLHQTGDDKFALLEKALQEGTLPIARVLRMARSNGADLAVYRAP